MVKPFHHSRDRLARVEPSELWSNATRAVAVGELMIDEAAARLPKGAFEPGLGARPGLCFLDGGLALVQAPPSRSISREGAERFALVDLAAGARVSVVTPATLLEPLGVTVEWLDRPIEFPIHRARRRNLLAKPGPL